MKKSSSYRRHRNPPAHDEQKQEKPFFSKGESKEQNPAFFKSTNTNVQTKLTVGQPGDPYEKEADSVADSVVNKSTTTPEVQQQKISNIQRSTLMTPVEDEKIGTAEGRMEKDKLIQEMPEGGAAEKEESVQMMEEEEMPVQKMDKEEEVQQKSEEEPAVMKMEEEEAIQEKEEEEVAQAKSQTTPQASNGLGTRLKSTKGGGKPLAAKTRNEMEVGIGADFKGVNIHTDAASVEMNQELKAQAFTNGKDVYFNTGKYRPETTEGKRLLAHELTHVVQQGGEEVQRKEAKIEAQTATQRFPTIGVYPIIGKGTIDAVRVNYIGTNESGLQVEFHYMNAIQKDKVKLDGNYTNFVNSVQITLIGNQLYYQWTDIEGTIRKVPIANPESTVPDGVFYKKQETILVPLTSPIPMNN